MIKKLKNILSLSSLFSILMAIAVFADDTAGDEKKTTWRDFLPMILIYGLIFVALYFIMIRPQKKRQKKEQNLRDSIILGDNVTTIGGITGRVIEIKDDHITIESSIDKTLVTFKKWAIRDVEKLITDDEAE